MIQTFVFVFITYSSEVRVMGFGADNLARVRALAEHPDAARMKGFLKTGEFWGTVGEQWVASDDR